MNNVPTMIIWRHYEVCVFDHTAHPRCLSLLTGACGTQAPSRWTKNSGGEIFILRFRWSAFPRFWPTPAPSNCPPEKLLWRVATGFKTRLGFGCEFVWGFWRVLLDLLEDEEAWLRNSSDVSNNDVCSYRRTGKVFFRGGSGGLLPVLLPPLKSWASSSYTWCASYHS